VCGDLSTWAGAPSSGPAMAIINRGQTDEEVVAFTGISSNTLIGVTRGEAGTSDQLHASGTIEHGSCLLDFNEANAHLADTTLDHHTQYLRTNGARASTGVQAFTFQAGTTHESNRVDGQVQVYGRGLAIAADSAVHQGGITDGVSVSVNRATPAIAANNANGDVFAGYAGSQTNFRLQSAGHFNARGQMRVGSNAFADTANGVDLWVSAAAADNHVYLTAEGGATYPDVGLVLRSKGAAALQLYSQTGALEVLRVMDDSGYGFGTSLILRYKGTGGSVFNQVLLGNPDSAGTGYRTLMVAN